MNALLERTLMINLICSTVVFYVGARIYVLPKVGKTNAKTILIPILILHSMRHLGLMFLAKGATYTGMSTRFAYPAATGDLVSAVLAFVAIFAVAGNREGGRFLDTSVLGPCTAREPPRNIRRVAGLAEGADA